MPIQIILEERGQSDISQEYQFDDTCKKCGCHGNLPTPYHTYNCLFDKVSCDIPLGDGSNLENVQQVAQWLLHPNNLVDTVLFIVRWTGNVPRLSKHHAPEADSCLFEVVLREHFRRKHGLSVRDQLLEEAERD